MRTIEPFVREKPYGGNAIFMGEADGPLRFIPSLGREVPTYLTDRDDLKTKYISANAHKSVDYHIPYTMRGPYVPMQLADYDPDAGYAITHNKKARCGGLKPDGQICQKSAQNRTGYCSNHGGALHPADKLFSSERGIMPSDTSKLSRLQLVEMGVIPVSELTNEEIAKQQVRQDDGTFSKKTNALSARIIMEMRSEFFARADQLIRESTIDLLEEMRNIALSPVEEAKDKIAAIQWLTERALGKTPDILLTNKTDAPFEQLLGDVTGGSRAAYRELGNPAIPGGTPELIPIDMEDDEDDEPTQNELPAAADVQHLSETGFSFPPTDGRGGHGGDGNASSNGAEAEIGSREGIRGDVDSRSGMGEASGEETKEEQAAESLIERANAAADKAAARKELKERIKKNRNRKYAARAQGSNTLDNLAFEVKFTTEKRLVGTGTHRMKIIAPEDIKAG